MRRIRLGIGLSLILGGLALGLYVAVYYASSGAADIRTGHVAQGVLQALVWSELLGIVASAALIIPGLWLLRRLDEKKKDPGR
jgi:uncharacterized membrane protein